MSTKTCFHRISGLTYTGRFLHRIVHLDLLCKKSLILTIECLRQKESNQVGTLRSTHSRKLLLPPIHAHCMCDECKRKWPCRFGQMRTILTISLSYAGQRRQSIASCDHLESGNGCAQRCTCTNRQREREGVRAFWAKFKGCREVVEPFNKRNIVRHVQRVTFVRPAL